MYKYVIILFLLIMIILINYNNENFTGFRRWGFLVETKNDPSLFPFYHHNKKIKHKCKL